MIVAKDATVHERLTAMMAARAVSRAYVALVAGVPSTSTGTIDAPIGRSPRDRKRMAVVDGGREAVTDFRLVEPMSGASLLEVMPRTGRTHQIRVHLAAIGHAVVGDAVYGRTHKLAARIGLQRPFLHALALRFEHPVTAELVEVEDPIPEDLEAALRALRDMAP
jgi:23S rRNA pseudouridine1911/1915/1917 synthase